MPVVPFGRSGVERPQQGPPKPGDPYLLMAAATMEEMGRLPSAMKRNIEERRQDTDIGVESQAPATYGDAPAGKVG